MQNHKDNQRIKDDNSIFDLSILSVLGDREDQQDSFGYSLKHDEGILVVCDGMGGHEGGKLASSVAVEAMLTAYENSYPCNSPEEVLIEKAKEIDKKIASLSDASGIPLGAGSTMVSVVIKEDSLYWCSVGDSRGYLFRQGEFVQFTQDQNYRTVLDEKLRANLITPQEYNAEMQRGESLISYLGIGNLSLIDYNKSPLKLNKEDKLLFMTDGLYKLVSDPEISRIVDNFSNISETLQALEMKAKRYAKNAAVNRDNMTVAIVKIK